MKIFFTFSYLFVVDVYSTCLCFNNNYWVSYKEIHIKNRETLMRDEQSQETKQLGNGILIIALCLLAAYYVYFSMSVLITTAYLLV